MKFLKSLWPLIPALMFSGPLNVLGSLSQDVEFAQTSQELTLSFGLQAPAQPIPGPGLKLYVWNIFKAKRQDMSLDFRLTSRGTDLALFQEAINHPVFTQSLIAANQSLGWTLAKSFSMDDGTFTGVATGSKVRPVNEEVILSEPTEPFTKTPKTILISEFDVNWQPNRLLVANIHAINFVTLTKFKVQIDQLHARLREHRGPVIVGGDFNTWNKGRMAILKSSFESLGIKMVAIPQDGFLNLDHVFVRGLKAQRVEKLKHIKSSDHMPIRMELRFENFYTQGYSHGKP